MFCIVAIPAYAIKVPINQSIDSTSWTPIRLGADQTCSSYAFQARDSKTFKVSATPDGSKYFTIKEGSSISVTEHHGVPGSVLFYAQTMSGSTLIEVFIISE